MTRTWTGLLVLAGLLVVDASDAAAQNLADELDARGLVVEVVAPEDVPDGLDLREIESADEAMSMITELCNFAVAAGGELAAILVRGPDGLIRRLTSAAGCLLCELIG